MSYSIVTTPGFVIASRPFGEAGKLLSIFTRKLGLVTASAQGIRLEKSKLRYAAQDYSFGEYSFVRGREFWRLTDASLFISNAPEGIACDLRDTLSSSAASTEPSCLGRARLGLALPVVTLESGVRLGLRMSHRSHAMPSGAVQELVARIAILLHRLLNGEEAHPRLFDCVRSCEQFLESAADLDEGRLETLESLMVARMLHLLGYIGDDQGLNGYLQAVEITAELLDALKDKRILLNRHINIALKESQL